MRGGQHLLIFRFSSLGDIAMTVPVITLLLEQHPELEVTMVTIPFVKPLFANIERLRFHEADLKGIHRGPAGMYKLFKELKSLPYTGIADLHNVLRTKMLRGLFSFSGIPVSKIDKGRAEKKELTRTKNKKLRQLKSTFQRYSEVFSELGYTIDLNGKGFQWRKEDPVIRLEKDRGTRFIGFAPMARYAEKTYTKEGSEELIRLLITDPSIQIFLFGGKENEEQFRRWEAKYDTVTSLAGRLSFEAELDRIASLDLMISMDSANMHLASMFGVPVVSVWGGTHPYLGFAGWKNRPRNFVQVELDCRPSSVFGNKACRNNCECMKRISPLSIYQKCLEALQK